MKNNHHILYWIKFGGFILYISILVYFLFFAEGFDRNFTTTKYRYNLIPLKEIKRFIIFYNRLGFYSVAINLIGNVVAFIPFGIFLPILSNYKYKFYYVSFMTFSFSITVELIQLLLKVGSFDVDDIILNTLGGIIGYLIMYLYQKVRNTVIKRR